MVVTSCFQHFDQDQEVRDFFSGKGEKKIGTEGEEHSTISSMESNEGRS